ncbi:hypothetical protein [Cohaesibacter celericrescens]|uniref:hypothetical protein n=1 Tax=Cohaesibacter celericrescens TaxID=2067669 RepID=UPI0035651D58
MVKKMDSRFLELDCNQILKTQKQKTEPSPIRILHLPGFRVIVDKLMLGSTSSGDMPTELRLAIDNLSKETFGITEDDTEFSFPEITRVSAVYWSDEHIEHENRFQTCNVNDEIAFKVLYDLGFDFRGDYGKPLVCLNYFKRQAEAAARGIFGKVPDINEADVLMWEQKMLIDVEKRQRRNRAKKQNQRKTNRLNR